MKVPLPRATDGPVNSDDDVKFRLPARDWSIFSLAPIRSYRFSIRAFEP